MEVIAIVFAIFAWVAISSVNAPPKKVKKPFLMRMEMKLTGKCPHYGVSEMCNCWVDEDRTR